MGRMAKKLREDYPDLQVCAPQNCETIALTVPADLTAEAVGGFVEQVSDDAKKRRTEVSGLLVEDAQGSRSLLAPEDLAEFTPLSVAAVEQVQRFVFDLSLAILVRAIQEIYDDVRAEEDGRVEVCSCVMLSLQERILSISWKASPLADMVADSVALAAVELSRNPTAVCALRTTEDAAAQEQRVFQVALAFLRTEYGPCEVDSNQVVTLTVDD